MLEKAENEKVHLNSIQEERLSCVTDIFGKVHRFFIDEFENVLEMLNPRRSSSLIHRLSITDPKKWLTWSVLPIIHRLIIICAFGLIVIQNL